ncbi:MAG TPA: DUF4365 domain-containing protein, partial [Longimicrobium sp.]|nr:DUF4365 domain-containing protein [Longimicrobium sp.]
YTTLVVRLSYTEPFEVDQLWRYAADFKTLSGRRVGLLMTKTSGAAAEMKVHFEAGVPVDTQVSFIKYIHEHLKKKARNITRVRSYVCPHCNAPLENRMAIRKRLELGKTDILCGQCEERVLLIDLIEQKFASDEFLIAVHEMDTQAQINLDKESLRLILVGHAFSVAMEAGQTFQAAPLDEAGTDGFIEFRDDRGELSGRRVFLVLWSGDSRIRGFTTDHGTDDEEAFSIEDPRLVASWRGSVQPVVLVIRNSEGQIRWMNLTDALKRHDPGDRQMLFGGEPFTALNVALMRNRMLA